jgi:hypothetical protein
MSQMLGSTKNLHVKVKQNPVPHLQNELERRQAMGQIHLGDSPEQEAGRMAYLLNEMAKEQAASRKVTGGAN